MYNKYQGYYSFEDLLSIAYLAAAESEAGYDETKGKYPAYIKPRIQGAIIRSVSNITSKEYKTLIKMYKFVDDYIATKGRIPAQHIIMEYLGLKQSEFMNLIDTKASIVLVSTDSLSEEALATPSKVDEMEEYERMMKVVSTLPKGQQKRINEFLEDPTKTEASIKDVLAIIRQRLDIKEK